jgi:hypothetical protein
MTKSKKSQTDEGAKGGNKRKEEQFLDWLLSCMNFNQYHTTREREREREAGNEYKGETILRERSSKPCSQKDERNWNSLHFSF